MFYFGICKSTGKVIKVHTIHITQNTTKTHTHYTFNHANELMAAKDYVYVSFMHSFEECYSLIASHKSDLFLSFFLL